MSQFPTFITEFFGADLARANQDDLKNMLSACMEGNLQFTEFSDVAPIIDVIKKLPLPDSLDLLIALAQELKHRIRSQVTA